MKRILLMIPVMVLAMSRASAQSPNPQIVFPDTQDYKVLKCDFHIHTLFSDGTVWPSERVHEAVMEGLDAIAITDHIEYRPNKDVVVGDHNKSYEIAAKAARNTGLLVIKGAEITREMPPGHWNALFIKDANKLDLPDYEEAMREAVAQGGYLQWNHPGWERQAPNETVMTPMHEEFIRKGYMMGIEVFNTWGGFFPEAFRWALDNNLTLVSGTDCHAPVSRMVNYSQGEHRAVTLVFAREKSLDAIHEALLDRRTAIYVENEVYGREGMLRELLAGVLEVTYSRRTEKNGRLTLRNLSSMPVYLKKAPGSEALMYERDVKIRPFETHSFNVSPAAGSLPDGDLVLNFTVGNFHTGPDTVLNCSYILSNTEK